MIQVITDKNKWNEALELADHLDFYHTYHYHHLSKQDNENPVLIKYQYQGNTILLPLLVRPIEGTDYSDATSVYGYSGVLTSNTIKNFNPVNFKKELNNLFKAYNIVSVFSRLHPFLKHQDIVLSELGQITSPGNVVYIDLSKSLEAQKLDYSRRLKTYLNKANKYCYIEKGTTKDDLNKFIQLYYNNMKKVEANKYYYFSNNYFEQLINSVEFKTELLLCKLKETDEIISAGLFIKTNHIVQYHLSGTNELFEYLNPVKFLIDYSRIKATNEGFQVFNLGGGRSSKDDSLLKFKLRFSKDLKPFKLWKYIVNPEVYHDLEAKLNVDKLPLQPDPEYFPSYRRVLKS
jgi:hypothetical protein